MYACNEDGITLLYANGNNYPDLTTKKLEIINEKVRMICKKRAMYNYLINIFFLVVRLAWFLRAANRRIAKTMPKGFYGNNVQIFSVMCNVTQLNDLKKCVSNFLSYSLAL
jgi:hypothetical protein